jgi:hypothetical protein
MRGKFAVIVSVLTLALLGLTIFKATSIENTIKTYMENSDKEPMTASYKSKGVTVTATVIRGENETEDQAAERLAAKIAALKKVFPPDPV